LNPRRLLQPLVRGSVTNVGFADMRRLVEAFGFELRRVSGSHHIFAHPAAPELLNLQRKLAGRPSRIRSASSSGSSSGTL